MPPRRVQDASKTPKDASKTPLEPLRCLQVVPSCPALSQEHHTMKRFEKSGGKTKRNENERSGEPALRASLLVSSPIIRFVSFSFRFVLIEFLQR